MADDTNPLIEELEIFLAPLRVAVEDPQRLQKLMQELGLDLYDLIGVDSETVGVLQKALETNLKAYESTFVALEKLISSLNNLNQSGEVPALLRQALTAKRAAGETANVIGDRLHALTLEQNSKVVERLPLALVHAVGADKLYEQLTGLFNDYQYAWSTLVLPPIDLSDYLACVEAISTLVSDVQAIMKSLEGWTLTLPPTQAVKDLGRTLAIQWTVGADVYRSLEVLKGTLSTNASGLPSITEEIRSLEARFKAFSDSLDDTRDVLAGFTWSPPTGVGDKLEAFFERLLQYLVICYLQARHPVIESLLELLGSIRLQQPLPEGPYRDLASPSATELELQFKPLLRFLSKGPPGLLESYQEEFDVVSTAPNNSLRALSAFTERFLRVLQSFLKPLILPPRYAERLNVPSEVWNEVDQAWSVSGPLTLTLNFSERVGMALTIFPCDDPFSKPQLTLAPSLNLSVDLKGDADPKKFSYQLDKGNGRYSASLEAASGTLNAELALMGDVKIGWYAHSFLDASARAYLAISSPLTSLMACFGAAFGKAIPPEENTASNDKTAVFLLGGQSGTHLELGGLALSTVGTASLKQSNDKPGFDLGVGATDSPVDGTLELELRATLSQCTLVIAPSDLLGPLKSLLGNLAVELTLDLGATWSSTKGLKWDISVGSHLQGGSTPGTWDIPLNINVGNVLKLSTLHLWLNADVEKESLTAGAGISGSLSIGPFFASVERLGLEASLRYCADRSGNLGLLDFGVGVAPPKGIALALDLPGIRAGGYLEYAADDGHLAGLLSVDIVDLFSLSAYGLLEQADFGYSFVGALFLDGFNIPLPLGFTLEGAGGLLGIHRTMNVDALRAGVRSGDVGRLMFPDGGLEDATKVIEGLKTYFPAKKGQYLAGIFAKFGWGGADFLALELGFLVELGKPIRVAMLGQVSVALPSTASENPTVRINLDLLGLLDTGQKLISLDASLYDSTLMGFTLSGDAALRLRWGDTPDFLLSIGGFRPGFQPAFALPPLRRMTLDAAFDENMLLHLESYFALTPNLIQFGAAGRLHVGFDDVDASLDATFSFDTLLQRSPFHFEVDLSCSVALKLWGESIAAGLNVHLTGPDQWLVSGVAYVDFLGHHEARFELTWGESAAQPVPVGIDTVRGELLATVNIPRNWTCITDAGWSKASEGLAQLPFTPYPVRLGELCFLNSNSKGNPELRVAPGGLLRFTQDRVPLNEPVQRYWGVPLAQETTFGLLATPKDSATVPAPLPTVKAPLPRGQFLNAASQSLTETAFSMMDVGFELDLRQLKTSEPATAARAGYEEVTFNQASASPAVTKNSSATGFPSSGETSVQGWLKTEAILRSHRASIGRSVFGKGMRI